MLSPINKMEIESSHSTINLLSKLIPDNNINLTAAKASVSSPNSSSRGMSFPPTPPGSRSPPASNFSPSPVQNEPRQLQVQNAPISFSIANILKPTFGATKPEVIHNESSERPKSLDIVLRTPPKTPEPVIRQESPVDLTHKHDLSLINNATNNSFLSHSINFLLNAQNTPVINPLQHHIHQQLLQQQVSQHLPHPVITKPIPLSTTTAFQLFKPLGSIAAEHQRRLQHHQQHQQLQLQLEQQRQQILKSQQIQSLNQHRLQKSSLELQSRKDESRLTESHHSSPISVSAPSPTPSSCSTNSSTSTSSMNMSISSDPNKMKEPSTETIEELVNPKVPDDNSNWPAWVYCTRYSDRPSSGPRSRRIKRSSRTPDEKRPRTAFTTDQLGRLKKEFDENRYLTEKRRQDLARELGLNESQIKIWFQNKRAKIKKSSGPRGGLAQHLMAQGLYNHCTVPVDEDDPYLN